MGALVCGCGWVGGRVSGCVWVCGCMWVGVEGGVGGGGGCVGAWVRGCVWV